MMDFYLLCCGSGIIALLATLVWAKWSGQGVRLIAGLFMGPSIALLSGVLFHIGTFVYRAIGATRIVELTSPDAHSGLWEWMRYSCISMLIPFFVGLIAIVVIAVISGMGPHEVITPLDGLDSFVTGAPLTDAFGCVALACLFLGPIPFGLIYGILGFALGLPARLAGEGLMNMQNSLALVAMTVLVWVGSLVSAARRKFV